MNTLLSVVGFDPDTDRELFIDQTISGDRHHALYDARVVRECFLKLMGCTELQRLVRGE